MTELQDFQNTGLSQIKVHPKQMQNEHDEEAPANEEDQHFQEKLYVPAGGGWKTLLGVGLLLLILGAAMLFGGIGMELWALVPLGGLCGAAGLICCFCTCCGITCIDPNQAVFLTYCTKYIGTMK